MVELSEGMTLTITSSNCGPTIRELVDLPGTEDIPFDPPVLEDGTFRVPDLTELADFQP